jgi:ABC-type multidrug transport system fused ATPase/permease subunit
VISLTASWRLGLVLLSVMPLVALGAKYQNKAFVGFSVGAAKALEESGHVAQEAASGLRVVAAFGLQGRVSKAYEEALQAPLAAGVARAWQGGLGLGFSQFMQFIVYSIALCVARACPHFTGTRSPPFPRLTTRSPPPRKPTH